MSWYTNNPHEELYEGDRCNRCRDGVVPACIWVFSERDAVLVALAPFPVGGLLEPPKLTRKFMGE